jgi:hypothetical protein
VYNEQGYQFTVATQRTYWASWVAPYRVDPTKLTLHKMDKLDAAGWVLLRTKFMQVRCTRWEASAYNRAAQRVAAAGVRASRQQGTGC